MSKLRNDIEFYRNERGEIGVLVSEGYGSGWSTDNKLYGINLALDKRIIEEFLRHLSDITWLADVSCYDNNTNRNEFIKFLNQCGYEGVYLRGILVCKLRFVPSGATFRISAYDGYERIQFLGDTEFVTVE